MFLYHSQEPEEVETMIQKFKSMLNDLKTTNKLSGSVVQKLTKNFDERIRAADTKLSEGKTKIK